MQIAQPKNKVGPQGEQGPMGPQGPQGEPGPKGDKGDPPAHQWRGTKLRFENPDGSWGKFVDLKGDKGETGKPGPRWQDGRNLGVGPYVLVAKAFENLTAGSYVSIFNNSGEVAIRLADRLNGRQADGFVKAGFLAGENAEVYFEGLNNSFSGLTIGAKCFLSIMGQVTNISPTGPGLWQYLGRAISPTAIYTEIDDAIERI